MAVDSTVSPTSTNPPGIAHPGGGYFRRTRTTRSPTSMTTSAVGRGLRPSKGDSSNLPDPSRATICVINFTMDFGHPAAIFVSSFIIGLSGAMMPGPLLAVTIRHASIRGFSAAPLLVLGHAILEAALVCLLLFGLMEWIRGDAAIISIALLGSAMLLRMAAGMAREVRTLHFDAAANGSPGERNEWKGSGGV